LIEFLVKKNPKIVWVFWGNESKKLKEKFRISNEFSIVSAHPSPFSANYGFFGSKPFSKINAILVNNGINPIDWEFD
jgi:uracil-DNA glycosylase